MHGARPTVLQGSDADGGDPMRAGVGEPGGNIAMAYFTPHLSLELEFDMDTSIT